MIYDGYNVFFYLIKISSVYIKVGLLFVFIYIHKKAAASMLKFSFNNFWM